MRNNKLFLLAILILPWLTIPFLGKKSFERYLPAAIFMTTFTKAIDVFAQNRKWWRFYKGIPPFDSMNFFNFGSYFFTSLWALKIAYGNFPLYLIMNVLLHIIFIFGGGVEIAKRFKIFSLERLTKLQYLGVNFSRALLLYGFQYITELSQSIRYSNSIKH